MTVKVDAQRGKIGMVWLIVCAGLGCAPGAPRPSPPAAVLHAQDSPQEGMGRVVAKSDHAIVLDRSTVTVNVPLPASANEAIVRASAGHGARVLLNLKGVDYKQNPGAGYEIYLNQPEGTPGDRQSAYYTGVLHFYGLKEAAQSSGQPAEVGFDITRQVQELRKTKQWSAGELTVTFVRSGVRPPAGGTEPAPAPEAVASITALEIVMLE